MRSRILLCTILLASMLGVGLVTPSPAGAVTLNPALPFQSVVVATNGVAQSGNVMDGNTQAVVDLGTRVIVGGNFTTVKAYNLPTTYTRNDIFAYNKATGAIDQTFVPQLDGQVTSMLNAGNGMIYVAGQFKHVNGVSAPFLVRINATTGALDPTFTPNPDGMVYDIRQVDNTIYLGGTFDKVKNIGRGNFAAVSATNGALLGVNVPFLTAAIGLTRVMRMAVSPDGSTMVVIGDFTSVGGLTRQNIAKLDLTDGSSATVDNWATSGYRSGVCSSTYDTYIRDVAFSPDGSYFIVGSTGAWFGTSSFCDVTVRWENNSANPAQPTWRDFTGGDSIGSVAATGAAVYSCGHFRWNNNNIPPGGDQAGTGSVVRQGISAYDPISGVPLAWNPSRERGLDCERMTPTPDGLYIMSDSSGFGTGWHPRITFVPTAGGVTPASIMPAALPVNLTYGVASAPGHSPTSLYQRSYDGTTIGAETVAAGPVINWSQVKGVVTATNASFQFLANGTVLMSTDGVTWATVPEWINFNSLTALAYGGGVSGAGRIFYTIKGDSHLYARGFSPDSQIISTLLNTVSGSGVDSMNWADTVGLTVIGSELYSAHSDGTLKRTDLVAGAPVAASTVTVSGPSLDGLNWSTTNALQTTPGPVVPPTTTTTTTLPTTTTTTTIPTTTTSTTTTTIPTTTTSTTTTTPTTTTIPPSPIFTDGFDQGLANWTNVSGLTVDTTTGAPGGTPPSIAAKATGARASGQRSFTPSHSQVCASLSVLETQLTGNTNIMRLRTTTSSVARLYVMANGQLYVRSDASGTQLYTGLKLTVGTWAQVQMCAGTGASGYVQLTVNGVAGPTLTANNGTTALSIIEIGDANVNTWSGSFDNVSLTDPTGA